MRRAGWVAGLAVVVAACGGGQTGADGGGAGIEISGSSTVEPITARVAEAFEADNPDVAISVEGPGTGDGFSRFCNGETDISDASRPIKEAERESCVANGVEFVELHVANDGITVLTAPANGTITCLDFGDLYALVGPESEGFQTWADADDLAGELAAAGLGGSHAPYPEEALVITAPGEESGTFDTFVELALQDIGEQRLGEEYELNPARADYEASANDNVIVAGIGGNPTSLGWVGFAFFDENRDVVKAIEVDGGSGCVAPTHESIAGGTYPLSRPLFIYVSTTKAAAKPELTAFVDFYLSEAGLAAVEEADFVALPAAGIEATRAVWAGR